MTLAVTVVAVVNAKELKKKFPLKCVKYHDCLIMKLSKVTQYRVRLKFRSHCCVLTFLSYRLQVCNGNEIYIRKKSLLSSPEDKASNLSLGEKLLNYGKNKEDKYSFGFLYQNKLLTYFDKKKYIALGSRKHRQLNI